MMSEEYDLVQKWQRIPEFHRKTLRVLASERGSARYSLKQATDAFDSRLKQFEQASAEKREMEKAVQEADAAIYFYLKSMEDDLKGLLSKEDLQAIMDGKFCVHNGEWKK